MSLFVKRKESGDSPAGDAVAHQIAGNLISGQKRVAGFLNSHTAHLPKRIWLYALVIFCLVFGGYCFWLLIGAINT